MSCSFTSLSRLKSTARTGVPDAEAPAALARRRPQPGDARPPAAGRHALLLPERPPEPRRWIPGLPSPSLQSPPER